MWKPNMTIDGPAKRILIVTPSFPWPPKGACAYDRTQGIKDFVDFGFEVRVIAKYAPFHDTKEIEGVYRNLGVRVFPVSYKYLNYKKWEKLLFYLKRFLNPTWLDGSAFEYRDKEIRQILDTQLREFNPDLVWFDYTFMWPLFDIVRKYQKKIVMHSEIFEPLNLLEEKGYSMFNYLRCIPKFLSEYLAVRGSDLFFSITPNEEKIYKKLGAKRLFNLPLRSLSGHLERKVELKEKAVLDVFFMGANYNVPHNRRSLEFIIKEVGPKIDKIFPNRFKFHILGRKFPQDLVCYLRNNIVYEGYVENIDIFLEKMDIALSPSFNGAGMQQKIFEPIARGFPTITNKRGLAGYDFMDGEGVLLFESFKDLSDIFGRLLDLNFRKSTSERGWRKANQKFSKDAISKMIIKQINNLLNS